MSKSVSPIICINVHDSVTPSWAVRWHSGNLGVRKMRILSAPSSIKQKVQFVTLFQWPFSALAEIEVVFHSLSNFKSPPLWTKSENKFLSGKIHGDLVLHMVQQVTLLWKMIEHPQSSFCEFFPQWHNCLIWNYSIT